MTGARSFEKLCGAGAPPVVQQSSKSRSFRHLVLADSWLPHAGGSRVYYHNLFLRLAREFGHSVVVVTKRDPEAAAFDCMHKSARYRITRRFRPLGNWKYWKIWNLLCPLLHSACIALRTRPDFVYSGDLYPQGVIALTLSKVFRVAYIAFCHGEEITQTDKYSKERRVRNAIYLGAIRVIAASEFAHQALIRIGVPDSRIVKINPGVDAGRFMPGPGSSVLKARLRLEEGPVLLTVGRLVPRKGHALVLKAIGDLRSEFPNLRYVIAGTGPEQAVLHSQAIDLGVEKMVVFAGYIPEVDMADLYRLADIFVLPNYEEERTGDLEGFGMVFLEANAAGIPVIAGTSGGTGESVVDGITGLRINALVPGELTRALRQLLCDEKLRRSLGASGMRRVRSAYSWGDKAASLDKLCQELAEPAAIQEMRP